MSIELYIELWIIVLLIWTAVTLSSPVEKKKNVLNSLISVWKGTYQDVREGKIPLYLLCKGQKVT